MEESLSVSNADAVVDDRASRRLFDGALPEPVVVQKQQACDDD